MGSRIAAHFANAGIPALLLDIVLPDQPDRNAAALKGLEVARKQRPEGFFTEAAVKLVTVGNFEDDLEALQECDWIIEAVTENFEIKRRLLEKVAGHRRPGAIISTNTSGIPLARLAEGFSPDFRRNFLGTHFFNPPRYLHVLELVPGPETEPEVLEFVSDFCDRRLGKGVVPCKDTPNFIGNRVGVVFFCATAQKLSVEEGYTIEEVDTLTGPLIGLPRTATYRLMDLIGIDICHHIAQNGYDLSPQDPWRDRFRPLEFIRQMMQRGWLGDKTGQGFFKRVGKEKEIHVLDLKTLEYHPAAKVSFPSVDAVKGVTDLGERLRMLVHANDRAGNFLWKLLSDLFLYCAERIPEISDRVVEIDRVMRWGFAWTLGVFEMWDAIGVEETVARMRQEGRRIPENVAAMLDSGARSFYRAADRAGEPRTEYYDFAAKRYQPLEARPGIVTLSGMKRARGTVKKAAGASLVDLGDGVLAVELHAKGNVFGEQQLEMIQAGLEEAARNFAALVIASEALAFSAGPNLAPVLEAARNADWKAIESMLRRFQGFNMAVKYAKRPVVAAVFGMTAGGGCETALHAARIQASAETYMGLTDASAGLIPAAGGTKELLLHAGAARALDLIASARVSTSADHARELGLLRPLDCVSMNPERILGDAKTQALALVQNYVPGAPRTDIAVAGEAGFAQLKAGAQQAREANKISDHDLAIAEKLAWVLSGGKLSGAQQVSEQYLLDLEREAFLGLCGQPKTLERMESLVKTGKPLRN
jgi:3-hydroxyacyl-CoA dehydrogenase